MSLPFETAFTKGGVCQFSDFGVSSQGYFGWSGYGGSQFFWNPEHKISFAYVPLNYENTYMRHINILHIINKIVYKGATEEESKTPERPSHWQKLTPLDSGTIHFLKYLRNIHKDGKHGSLEQLKLVENGEKESF